MRFERSSQNHDNKKKDSSEGAARKAGLLTTFAAAAAIAASSVPDSPRAAEMPVIEQGHQSILHNDPHSDLFQWNSAESQMSRPERGRVEFAGDPNRTLTLSGSLGWNSFDQDRKGDGSRSGLFSKDHASEVERVRNTPSENVVSFFATAFEKAGEINAKLHPDHPRLHQSLTAKEIAPLSVPYSQTESALLQEYGFFSGGGFTIEIRCLEESYGATERREHSVFLVTKQNYPAFDDGYIAVAAAVSKGSVARREAVFPKGVPMPKGGEPYDYQRYLEAVTDGVVAYTLQEYFANSHNNSLLGSYAEKIVGGKDLLSYANSATVAKVLAELGFHLPRQQEIASKLWDTGEEIVADAVTLRRDSRHIFNMIYMIVGHDPLGKNLLALIMRDAADEYRKENGKPAMTDDEYGAWATTIGKEGSTKGFKTLLDEVGQNGPQKMAGMYVELAGAKEIAEVLEREEWHLLYERVEREQKEKDEQERKTFQDLRDTLNGLRKKLEPPQ
jgi:hypothetical protein